MKRNSNQHPEPSEKVRNIMEERLKIDIELYNFAKQRLFKQWKKINQGKDETEFYS